jgi:hypothetical protein
LAENQCLRERVQRADEVFNAIAVKGSRSFKGGNVLATEPIGKDSTKPECRPVPANSFKGLLAGHRHITLLVSLFLFGASPAVAETQRETDIGTYTNLNWYSAFCKVDALRASRLADCLWRNFEPKPSPEEMKAAIEKLPLDTEFPPWSEAERNRIWDQCYGVQQMMYGLRRPPCAP